MADRSISDIAEDIRLTWAKPYFGAVPYLEAMQSLEDMSSRYFEDSAISVVSYFLANANTWKGEDARRIKTELRDMVTAHRTARVEL